MAILNCYAGFLDSREKLMNVSSGGTASFLAYRFIKNGGIVIGVKWDDDFRTASFVCIDDINDINLIQSTKYVSPQFECWFHGKKYNLFDLISKKLKNDDKILFLGVGCHVGALKRYLSNNSIVDDNLYTVDIICHGPSLDIVHKKFLDELENKYKSKVVELNHHYKNGQWIPKYLWIKFENGREFEKIFNETTFGKIFHEYAKPQCTNCKFKGNNHRGDICIGDFWGMNENDKGYNKNGTSLIFQQTSKGEYLISLLDDKGFKLFESNMESALKNNPMYSESRDQGKKYTLFLKYIKKYSINKTLFLISPLRYLKEKLKQYLTCCDE